MTTIRIALYIYAEVADDDEGQTLCNALDVGLENRIGELPVGQMVGVAVEHYDKPSQEELTKAGMTE